MEKIIAFMLCLVLFSCASTKKSVQTTTGQELLKQSNESQFTAVEKKIDTTKTENNKITITEIEFYPPFAVNNKADTTNILTSDIGNVNLPNVSGAIKSIKQTTIESALEQTGKSEESSKTEENQSETMFVRSEQAEKKDVTPAPDPYRWRYIFYILALLSGILLYLKRIPILNWIKTILSNVRRIF